MPLDRQHFFSVSLTRSVILCFGSETFLSQSVWWSIHFRFKMYSLTALYIFLQKSVMRIEVIHPIKSQDPACCQRKVVGSQDSANWTEDWERKWKRAADCQGDKSREASLQWTSWGTPDPRRRTGEREKGSKGDSMDLQHFHLHIIDKLFRSSASSLSSSSAHSRLLRQLWNSAWTA